MVLRSQDYHPANHISFASRHFQPAFAWEGGPIPDVGYPIDLHCTVADSGMIHDAHCCLVDTSQAACTIDGVNVCVQDTDPTNTACSVCAEDPSSCTLMPQALWTDHCVQTGDSGFATGLETPDTDIVLQKGTQLNIDAYSIFMDNTPRSTRPSWTICSRPMASSASSSPASRPTFASRGRRRQRGVVEGV
jgi:hypothetical protein